MMKLYIFFVFLSGILAGISFVSYMLGGMNTFFIVAMVSSLFLFLIAGSLERSDQNG